MLGPLRSAVEQHRAAISRHASEIEAIASAPVDAETASRRLDAEIERSKELIADHFRHLDSPRGGFSAEAFNRRATSEPFAFWASYDPDTLKEIALSTIRPGGLTDADRAKRLQAAGEVVEAAEIAEEIALREIDSVTGNHERRRLDARMGIILAPLAELQAAAKPAKTGGLFKRAS